MVSNILITDLYERDLPTSQWEDRAKENIVDSLLNLAKGEGENKIFLKNCEKWSDKRISKQFKHMDDWGGWYYRWCQGEYEVTGEPRDTPMRRMRSVIRSRMAPAGHVSRRPMPSTTDIRELRARETMRRVLGDEEYRRFMRHGFVSIDGKSGLRYQIFPGHRVTCVFDGREMVERLCVVLRGSFCPTDSLMMRYLMILNDEAQFRSFAVIHRIPNKVIDVVDRTTSLTELFRELKQVA